MSRFTTGVRIPPHRLDPRCLVGQHQPGPWTLRPPVTARPIAWMRWERHCSRRCGDTDRRWFPVPRPAVMKGLLSAEAYLRLIGVDAPDPDTLPDGTPPIEALL